MRSPEEWKKHEWPGMVQPTWHVGRSIIIMYNFSFFGDWFERVPPPFRNSVGVFSDDVVNHCYIVSETNWSPVGRFSVLCDDFAKTNAICCYTRLPFIWGVWPLAPRGTVIRSIAETCGRSNPGFWNIWTTTGTQMTQRYRKLHKPIGKRDILSLPHSRLCVSVSDRWPFGRSVFLF